MITDPTRPVVEGADTSSAVEAAAIARLYGYLQRAQPVSEADELIARDAYIQGFVAGARWGVRTTSRLANPEFREAVGVLAELMFGADQ